MDNKQFMLDIETTGIQKSDHDLMQIGILEMNWDGFFWQPGKSFELVQHTPRQPESEFAKKHQGVLYKQCNEAPFTDVPVVRMMMLEFFKSCGAESPNIFLCGRNITTFDVPFLQHWKYLREDGYKVVDGKDVNIADVHYRANEMSGAIEHTMRTLLWRKSRQDLIDYAFESYKVIEMPSGKEHEGLYDCYKQLRELNGLLHICRSR